MITGRDNIVKFLRFNNANYWNVKRSEKSEEIIHSDKTEKQTLEESVTQFNERFQILEPGTYFIEAYESLTNKTNWKKDTIIIKGDAQVPITQNNSVGSIMDEQTIGKITYEAVEKYKRDEYYKQLEQKNKELEENLNSLSTRFMERAEPIMHLVGAIISKKFGVEMPKQITGTKPQTKNTMQKENQTPEDLQKRAETAMEKWLTIDPEAIDLLEKIVLLAESNPDKYNMAKSFL